MIVQFLYELFQIGHSAGSLITEALSLFKTFQRLSATKSFTVHFSKECLKMFLWAKNLIQIIMSNFYVRKASEMELLYLYNYVFPVFLVTFIALLSSSYRFYIHFIISVVFFFIGFSLGNLQLFIVYFKYGFPICIGITLLIIIIISCKKKWVYLYGDDIQSSSRITFTFSLFNSLLCGAAMLYQFLFQSLYFISCTFFIIEILTGVSFIVEIIVGTVLRKNEDDYRKSKMTADNEKYIYDYNIYFIPSILTLLNNLFPLLIIPCTEHFIEAIKSIPKIKYAWPIIIGYVIIGLILPILMTFFLALFEYSDFINKYRGYDKDEKNYHFVYYELYDILKQIIYAIAAAYDQPIACLCIEVAWILAVLIPRPYKNVSDYFLQGGSSLIVIVSNILAIICKYKKTGFLSFAGSLTLVIFACVPAVISLFVYFIVDFEIDEEFDLFYVFEDKGEDKEEISSILSVYYRIAMPFVLLFFGLSTPYIAFLYFNFGGTPSIPDIYK